MRAEFVTALADLADADERIMLLTGDLGFAVLDPFVERHPDRFLNVGVAEQNMVGMATGLAEAGFVPFVYSIATFASMRPYEFIRNGPVAHRLPVRVVGVGGGFEYGHNGLSHYALEDVAIMRAQPGMTVIVPADAGQAVAAVRASVELEGPVYFRVGKGSGTVPGLEGAFGLGRAQALGEGDDVILLATGSIARAAVEAVALLHADGIAASVIVVPTFNPSPDDEVAERLARATAVVTAETHYRTGGLGSWAAELIAERGLRCRLARAGVEGLPTGSVGPQAALEARHGLDAAGLARRGRDALQCAGADRDAAIAP